MENIVDETPQYIREWIRELLGTRGYLRALNDEASRTKIRQLGEWASSSAVAPDKIRDICLRTDPGRGALDAVLNEIKELAGAPTRKRAAMVPPAAPSQQKVYYSRSAPPPDHSPAAPPVEASSIEIETLRSEVRELGYRAAELEELVRELTARAVIDATRIKGLESALMALGESAGVKNELENVYGEATKHYIRPRLKHLHRSAPATQISPTNPTTTQKTRPTPNSLPLP